MEIVGRIEKLPQRYPDMGIAGMCKMVCPALRDSRRNGEKIDYDSWDHLKCEINPGSFWYSENLKHLTNSVIRFCFKKINL